MIRPKPRAVMLVLAVIAIVAAIATTGCITTDASQTPIPVPYDCQGVNPQ